MTPPTTDPGAPENSHEEGTRPEIGGRSARAAFRVGAGIFLSRLSGLARQRSIAHFFGSSDAADAFGAALRLPNVVQNLLGEGTLSASMIPVYAEFLEEGREEDAARFAGAVLGILLVVAGVVTLLGVVVAPLLVALVFNDWDGTKQALTTSLVRILFPMTGLLVISAWALGILNSHRKFFVSYVAPVLWNGAMIAALVTFGLYFGWDDPRQHARLVRALGWGALVGGGLQLLVQLPFVLPLAGRLRLSLGRRVLGVREAIQNFVPVVLGRGVVNLSTWIDLFIAGQLAGGAIAILQYAQTLYVLPISLFGMSVAASELPELSRERKALGPVLRERVRGALERVRFWVVPSVFAYLVLGDVLTAALYQTGDFDLAETLLTWAVLGAFSLGLVATTGSRVLSSAYYAIRDTRTPARLAAIRVGLSALVALAVIFPLDRIAVGGLHGLRLGAVGLGAGATVGAWFEYVMLRRRLRREIGPHAPDRSKTLRVVAAAAVASAAGVIAEGLLPPAEALAWGWIPGPVVLALGTALPFGVVYLAVAAFLGLPLRLPRR